MLQVGLRVRQAGGADRTKSLTTEDTEDTKVDAWSKPQCPLCPPWFMVLLPTRLLDKVPARVQNRGLPETREPFSQRQRIEFEDTFFGVPRSESSWNCRSRIYPKSIKTAC